MVNLFTTKINFVILLICTQGATQMILLPPIFNSSLAGEGRSKTIQNFDFKVRLNCFLIVEMQNSDAQTNLLMLFSILSVADLH